MSSAAELKRENAKLREWRDVWGPDVAAWNRVLAMWVGRSSEAQFVRDFAEFVQRHQAAELKRLSTPTPTPPNMPAPTRARRARRRNAPTRPLACHACGEARAQMLGVERGQQRRKLHGVLRTVVNVFCGYCGNEFWSCHPTALRIAKQADAEARG